MNAFPTQFRITVLYVIFLLAVLAPGLTTPAAAADIEMDANLGDTITLHGVSYVGDSVYLFLTGPGLPVNGVTLTDTSQRADQGHFTIVRLDDKQEWTYIWKTSRIDSEIDPGTYTVYVTNEPADLSHLGGTNSYKTLSVFLKDSGISKVSIEAGKSYTLRPEDNLSTPRPAPSMNITNATPDVISQPPTTTAVVTAVRTVVPTTRAGTGPLTAVTALFCGVCLAFFLKGRL